jgi:hypothetical protein
LRDDLVEPEDVTIEKPPEIFRCGRDVVKAEKFADQIHIGASGKPDFLNAVARVELRGEGPGKGLRTGPPRVNERAINIKQNEPHHPEKLPEFEVFRENFQDGCRMAVPGSAGVPPAGGSQGTGRRDAGAPREQWAGASFRIARFVTGAIMPA